MEKIGCPNYGGLIELPVAAGWFKEEGCKECDYYALCKKTKEGQDGK